MKKNIFFLSSLIFLLCINQNLFSQNSGIFEAYVITDTNGSGDFYSNLVPSGGFNGADFGDFDPTNSLILRGGQAKTFKNGSHNVFNSSLFYRIYPTGSPSGAFIEINLNFDQNLGNPGDQQWDNVQTGNAQSIDVLAGLATGNYTLEVFVRSQVDTNNDNQIDLDNFWSDFGNNFKATFDFFADADNDGFASNVDCDDTNPAINPNAQEICDGIDNDCDNSIDTADDNLIDTEAPTAVCQDLTVELDASGSATITAAQIDNGSSDNCGNVTLAISQDTFSCADIGSGGPAITDLFISEYVEGSSSNKYIEIYNGTGADVDLSDYELRLYSNGASSASTTNTLSGILADGDVIVYRNSSASVYAGPTTVLSAVNWNGDDAIELFKISTGSSVDIFGEIGDDPGSQWNVSGNNTQNQTLRRNTNVLSGNTVNSAGFPTLGTEWTETSIDDVSDLGSHTVNAPSAGIEVTLTVTDDSGNESTCKSTIMVVDLLGPTPDLANLPDITESCEVTVLTAPTATDNCGGTVTVTNDASLPISTQGTTVVTWTYEDDNGNTSTQTQNIIINDSEAPTAVCQDLTVELDASGSATITAAQIDNGSSDNCGNVTLAISQDTFTCADIGGNGAGGITELFISEYLEGSSNNKCIEIYNGTGASVDLDAEGYILIRYTNGSSSGVNIPLSGTIADGDVHVICNGQSSSAILAIANQTSGSMTFNGDDAMVLFKDGTAIDIFGQIGNDPGSQWSVGGNVTANRTLIRNSDVLAGNTVNTPGFPTLGTEWTQLAQDDISNLGSHSVNTPSTGAEVILTVTDDNGNQATCTATVTVTDLLGPTPDITNLADVTGQCEVTALTAPTATDNCGGTVTVTNDANLPISTQGTTIITWTYEDDNGNTSTQTQNVIIEDTEAPTAVCQDISVELDASGSATITAAQIDNGSSDNCGNVTLAISQDTFSCADMGSGTGGPTTNEVWINEFHYDNVGSDVNEFVEVVATFDASSYQIVFYNGSNGTSYGTENLTLISTDSGYNFYRAEQPGSGIQNGGPDGLALVNGSTVIEFLSYEGTFAATNGVANGLSSTDVGVSETNSTPIGSSIHRIGSGSTAADFSWATTTSNTSGAINNGQSFVSSGGVEVTLTVTDENGNQSTCTATVTVTDKLAPTPDNATLADVTDECEITALTAPTATDNCGGAVTVTNDASLPISTQGTTVVTWTYEDDNGNTSTQTQNIIINDMTNPVAVCQDISVNLDANGMASWSAADINNGSTDNCGIASVSVDKTTFDCNDVPKLLISGVIDGPLSGGVPKAVELYVLSDIADLSEFGIGTAFNGGSSDGADFIFPSTSVSAGTFIYVASETTGFVNFFGFSPDYTSSALGVNGDDAFELFQNGTVIDVFGEVGVDGTGEAWEYLDGWAYRVSNTGPDGDTFNVSNWSFSGTNALDGETENNTAITPFPAGGFTASSGLTFNTSVVLTVTDGNGNSSSCTATVTIIDPIVPEISCPSDIVVNNDPNACGAIVTFTTPIGSDNCVGSATTQTAGLESGSVFPIGTTTNTFEVTDSFGNSVECSFTVTVIDNEAPTIACPSDMTINNDADACGAIVNYALTTSDNCPDAVITQTSGLASGSTFPIGTTTNAFTITDASGNSVSCSFDVTVVDNQNPVIDCPSDIVVDNDLGQCGATVVYNVSGTDNCPGETLNMLSGLASGEVFPIGTTNVSYELVDASGNAVTCLFSVTVNDTEAPTINCPSNIVTVNDVGACSAVVNYTITSGDNCLGASVAQTSGLASGAAFPIGVTTNTFVITDASGNSETCSFDVVVNDTEAPTIDCPADIAVVNDIGACAAIVNYTVTGADNCPGYTITQIAGLASGDAFPIGITTNSFEIEDASGNITTCSFNVTVSDSEQPTINCPSLVVVDNDPGLCGAMVDYTVDFSDNCPGVTIIQTSGFASGALFPVGTTVNTFVVTDASGNTNTCSFEVTVDDKESPVIACPSDIVTGNDLGSCYATVTYDLTVSDNCPGTVVTQTEGLPSGSQFPIGDTTNKFTVTDASGNTALCFFIVTVEDTESPTPGATLPDIVAQCEATVAPPTAPDNCKGTVTGTTNDPTTYTEQGSYVITWTFDDGSGNVSQQLQNVIIEDTIAPEIPIINDFVDQCFATVPVPSTTDNCSGVIFGTTTDPTNYTSQGNYTVNWTFDDGNGNSIVVPQTIIVDDISNPVPDVSNLPTLTAECSLDITTIPSATDNCLGSILGTTTDPTSYTEQGNYSITWSYDDGNGNVVTQTQTIIINDTSAPDAIALPDVIGQCDTTVTAPTTTDNCAGIVTGSTTDPLVYTTQGNYLIIWTFDDGNGNSFNATQNVIIDDTEAPIPDAISLANVTGECDATVSNIPTATDNCKGAISATTNDPLTYTDQGTYSITWTFDDGNGNVSTQEQTVIVSDTTNPTLSACPSDITLCGEQSVLWTAPTASDNCAVTLSSTHNPGDVFDIGTTTVVYTATDNAGNAVSCSFDVTISATPIISIVETPLDGFCQGLGELTVVVANASDFNEPLSIVWSDGSTDDSIIIDDNNTYTVTVSSQSGCEATTSYTSSTNPEDVLSGYVMLGKRGVRLIGSRVFDGGVGVTDNNRVAQVRAFSQVYGFVKSDYIYTDWFSYVQDPIFSDADVTLPTFYNNTAQSYCGDDITVQPYDTVVLDEEVYDDIYVRYGATLIIDAPEVYIDRLKTDPGVTIIFNQSSAVMIDEQMRIGSYNTIDRNGYGATFYVEKDVRINGSVNIEANIYSKRSIKVSRAGYFYRTKMRGLFIALKNIQSSFFVDWYPSNGCATTPIPDGPPSCFGYRETVDASLDIDEDKVKLYPVPTVDILNISLESPVATKANYSIASMRGEVSIQNDWTINEGQNTVKVDVTRLSDGLYNLIIKINGETISKQFVVKRGK